MKPSTKHTILLAFCSMLFITSCDNKILKGNAPHKKIQVGSKAGTAIKELVKKKDNNRYIIIYKKQPNTGIATVQTAQQAVATTKALFTSYKISTDSLIH